MRTVIVTVVCFVQLCGQLQGDVRDLVSQRALEYAVGWSTEREEPSWLSRVIPEYLHPEANDSGLPARIPSFAPTIPQKPGLFLFANVRTGRITSGRSPWVLQGRQEAYAVELVFRCVAEVTDRVEVYEKPIDRSEVVLMALDSPNGTWKVLDHFPYQAYFYQIPYFLKAWPRITGKDSIANIDEVRSALVALAAQTKR